MKIVDPKQMLKSLQIESIMCKIFAQKLGKSEEEISTLFNEIVDKEISNIGRSLAEGQIDSDKLSRLRGLSLQDFMKDNDKIIKDK